MSEASTLVHAKLTLADMWDACAGAAYDLDVMQRALVAAGLRSAPDEKAMARVRALETTCRFIEVVREVEPELRALIARKRGWSKREGDAR